MTPAPSIDAVSGLRADLARMPDGERQFWSQKLAPLIDALEAQARELAEARVKEIGWAAKLVNAQSRIAALEDALKPFAAEADEWHDDVPDGHRSLSTEPGNDYAHPGSETVFTVGDLRRARAALAKGQNALVSGRDADPDISSLRKEAADLRRAICNIVDAVEISISLEFHPLTRKRLAEAKLLIDRPALVSGSREDGADAND